MKKSVVFIPLAVVLIGGYFAFSIFYTNKKIDEFFHHNGGDLYERAGFRWSLASAKTGLFSGKYETEVFFNEEKILIFEHDVAFGARFNPLKVGSIQTKGKLIKSDEIPDITDKEFNLKSSITLGGIDTDVSIKSDSIGRQDIYSGEYENLTWRDAKGRFFISFGRDELDIKANIPFVKFDGAWDEFVIVEDQKYESHSSKKETGVWIGDSIIDIGRVEFSGEPISFSLSKLKARMDIFADKGYTLKNVNKISFDDFKYSNIDSAQKLWLSDIVFNINLENLDTNSMRKIYEAISSIDLTNEAQANLVLLSLFAYTSDILAKQPKIVLEELSGKYSNQSCKISGFVQYTGDGDLQKVYTSLDKDIVAEVDFEVAQKALKEYFRADIYKYYYGYDPEDEIQFREDVESEVALNVQEFEDEFDIKADKGIYKGTLEFKDGGYLLDGRPYEPAGYDF
ncbi:MAG: YdgA family protein [Campylobacteraceae bacterium]|jgi:uncharacterized protein YdgA (DUF945 family)|nr:YdgA family protein [Campylobacteraceae bacterium]